MYNIIQEDEETLAQYLERSNNNSDEEARKQPQGTNVPLNAPGPSKEKDRTKERKESSKKKKESSKERKEKTSDTSKEMKGKVLVHKDNKGISKQVNVTTKE